MAEHYGGFGSREWINSCFKETHHQQRNFLYFDLFQQEQDDSLIAKLTKQTTLPQELQNLAEKNGMPIRQINGQRYTGPPTGYDDFEPAEGCEVFVGGIPRDCYEPELLPLLQKVGRVYLMRMMMNFSGTNRGYCFVKYFTPEEAQAAISAYHHYELRPGTNQLIGVVRSIDNRRLLLRNIARGVSIPEIYNRLKPLTCGLTRVFAPRSDYFTWRPIRCGYAILEFISHQHAANARHLLLPSGLRFHGVKARVEWAKPNMALGNSYPP